MFANIKGGDLIAGKTVRLYLTIFYVFFALITCLQEFLNVAPKMQELHTFFLRFHLILFD